MLVAAALTLLVGLLYALTFQTRYYNDGPGLVSMHALQEGRVYYHVLYLPACSLVESVLGLADPLVAPRLLSILPGALGCGFAFLVLRLCGGSIFGALAGVLLLALSPSMWFFGTTVEVHALVFCAVALVALVTLLAPWHRPMGALFVVAAAFPLLYWSHQATFVLGPGWVLFVQFARARHGGRFSWRALLLEVGPVLLGALVFAIAIAAYVRFGSLVPAWEEVQRKVHAPETRAVIEKRAIWLNEWLLPLGLLVPLAFAGAARIRRPAELGAAIAALIGVPLFFFLWWGTLEKGGYFLSSSVFLLVPVAFLLDGSSRARILLALLLLAAQATYARARIDAFDTGWDPAERVEQVRSVLGESGLLLTTVTFAPNIHIALPGVEEHSLTVMVRQSIARSGRSLTPAGALEPVKPFLARLLERHARVAVEIGFHRVTLQDSPSLTAFAPYLKAIEDFLREQYVVSEFPHPYWPMLLLERRK